MQGLITHEHVKTVQTRLQYNPHALSSYVNTYSCRMKAYSVALQQFLL